jgi:ElaB/YqjD/DUF883 family membrane-anchored ribosome-binding protein
MKAKTSETPRLFDQAAKTAHKRIGRVHERVVKMEDALSNRAQESGERVVATFERRAQALTGYIEANPVKSAAIAFGIGVWASRLFKATELMSPETDPGAEEPLTGKTQKPDVGEEAA